MLGHGNAPPFYARGLPVETTADGALGIRGSRGVASVAAVRWFGGSAGEIAMGTDIMFECRTAAALAGWRVGVLQ